MMEEIICKFDYLNLMVEYLGIWFLFFIEDVVYVEMFVDYCIL